MKQYQSLHEHALQDPETYWGELATRLLTWNTPFNSVLDETNAPFYRWFGGGTLNLSEQCIDRHLPKRATQTALIWEGESGETRSVTYGELAGHVNRFANLLKDTFKVTKGDRVVIYMPMILEAAYAMLACARIGAVHVVVFGGFSAVALRERIIDSGAKLVITADGAFRHGEPYMLKTVVDEALEGVPKKNCSVLVVEHNHQPLTYRKERDFKYHSLIKKQSDECPAEAMDSEDILFILHTSGSTGKPKGIIHTTAGYALWAQYTTEHVFDLHPEDRFWCTADIGWITGHTYTVYGPLMAGATTLMFEGVPTYPDANRFWQVIEKHRITQFYTAPTAIRILKKSASDGPDASDLSSLKVIGTVGEPINPAAWCWYHDKVGGGKCPIVDTWWQTENGGHLIAPLPGATPTIPGSATLPLPGISAAIIDEDGVAVAPGEKGLLCITKPWPSMLRGIWGDTDGSRYLSTYFATAHLADGTPVYFSGDTAYYDEHGYIVVTGRADDVMNISGHRVGTAEIEAVLSKHPLVAEAGAVSRPDELRGEEIVAFVVLQTPQLPDELHGELNALLKQHISAMVKVGYLFPVPGLPKTRSGKIMRRILRSIARNEPVTQDISTLDNPDLVATIEAITHPPKSTS